MEAFKSEFYVTETRFGIVEVGMQDKKLAIRYGKSVYETFETAKLLKERLDEIRLSEAA